MNLSPPSAESVAILCYGALQSQCCKACIILHIFPISKSCFFLVVTSLMPLSSMQKFSYISTRPAPSSFASSSKLGEKWDAPIAPIEALLESAWIGISLSRVQIKDLASLANYSAPPVWHLHSDLAFLSSLRIPATHALQLYHSQGSSPTLACTAELNGEIPVTPYRSPCRCALPGLAQLQTEADKMYGMSCP